MDRFQNRLFQGDNLKIMREMPSASVNLIYLDPPFCTGKDFKAFDDRWHDGTGDAKWYADLKANHEHLYQFIELSEHFYDTSMKTYLTYLTVRLFEMKRILKDGRDGEDGGSIHLHCDPTASHYLKLVMDSVFGKNNFRNEIVWHYRRWTAGTKNFQRMHDVILRYTKSDKFKFIVQYEPYGDWIKKDYSHTDSDGKRWRWHTVKGKRYKVYLEDENRGVKLNDVWQMPHLGSTAKERIGYPTQKPLKLLDRIIKASSNENDVVLDPFCGSGTTLESAKRLGRHYIGIDQSPEAIRICEERLNPRQGRLF